MKFNDQLRRALDTMNERLRGAVDRQVEIVVEELAAAAQAEREHAISEARESAVREATGDREAVVATARQEAHEEGLAAGKDEGHRGGLEEGRQRGLEEGRQQGLEEGRQQGRDEGRQQGLEEGRQQGRDEGRQQGLEEGRQQGREEGRQQALDEGRQQGRDEGRQQGLEEGQQRALEEGQHRGLQEGRQQGFEDGRQQGLEDGRQQGLEDGRRQGSLEGRQQAEQQSRETLDNAVAAARAERVVDGGDPKRLSESVRALAGARSLSEILDTLITRAGQESGPAGVWIIRGGHLRRWRSTGTDAAGADLPLDDAGSIAEAARTNAVATSNGTLAVPIAMADQVVAVLSTSAGANDGAIEIMARYAARSLEVLTAFKAARTLTAPSGRPGAHAPATSAEAIVEDEASARRYARLLVSEIKLYHESAVVDGRRDRDLATRLGGEIARARVLYDERVPPQVRERGDYFRDELVRTLADGDATLLQLT